jgi:putative ABC transport system permease protein
MDTLLQDIRYALRMCVRTPGFTIIAVLALALGIGANTAIFTIVNAVLLERLPFREPQRIVSLWEEGAHRPGKNNSVGPANFIRWRERSSSFDAMAAMVDLRANLTGGGDPEEVVAQTVEPAFFPILGVSPLVGRTFTDAENRDPQVAVVILAYDFWQRRFGGDRAIVGQTIQLNGRPQTVVGVMPHGFRLFVKEFSIAGKPADLWRPYVLPADARDFSGRYMQAIAQLKPGVSVERAQTELSAIAAALATEFPARNAGWGARVLPLHAQLSGEYRTALLVLSGAVAFVLLIACANVANLLLARGAARQREIAIRSALGAARSRVVRQLLTESFVLALFGGALGLLVAQWGVALLLAISPVDLNTTSTVSLSYPVLLFTATASLLTAIVCGLAPAFEGSRTEVQETLKDGARQVGGGVRHRRLRQTFVVAEIALAVVLLVGAGLMLRSFGALQRVNPGYSTNNILTMRLQLPNTKYRDDEQRIRFFREAISRIQEVPGVQSAGAISYLPLTGLGAGTGFTIEGQPPPPPGRDYVVDVSVCDNGYFKTMDMPLKSGRFFSERETAEKSNVVIVSESLARTYFPQGDALGKRLVIEMTRPTVPTEIIGIVGDVKFRDLTAEPHPTTYWPHPQLAYSGMTFTVRTAAEPLSMAPSVERAIRTLDKDQPVAEVRTMNQWVAKSLAQARFSSTLLTIFANLALALAAIGIYGVMSYAVSQRTSEIGIRLALGATMGDVLTMIVLDGLRLAVFGLALGVLLAIGLSRTIATLLYETTGTDPVTFAAVIGVLGAAALLASYLPARRASKIPPVEALRAQ